MRGLHPELAFESLRLESNFGKSKTQLVLKTLAIIQEVIQGNQVNKNELVFKM